LLLVVHVENMEERICFRLNIADGISEIRETWTGCLFGLLKRTFIVYFVFVMVDCILCENAFIRLIVNEFGCSLATW
jgi:hypothetical protein